jgi:nucleoside-diphosphate-sugar epimerase
MRIVIVGGSGNVGTALLRELKADGSHEVVGVARRRPADDYPYNTADWHSLDVSDDSAAATLTELFDGADSVVNLAWGFQPARDVGYLHRVGVGGLEAVLMAGRSAGVPHLIHMSSVGAYSAAPRGEVVQEDWPTDGVQSLPYSLQKAAAERVLDRDAEVPGGPAICRLRPGLIMQRQAGSGLLRYGVPALFPAAGLDLLPLLPLDRTFAVPIVHARDVAAAVVAALHRRATGPFNLGTATPLTPDIIASVLRARVVHVPWKVLRAMVSVGWNLRLERLDPGWIDLAFSVPLIDSARARTELGWEPIVDTRAAFREVILGMRSAMSTGSQPLRRRSVAGEIRATLESGPITRRQLP